MTIIAKLPAAKLALIGVGLGLMPHLLGILLSFAAFVVTPVVGFFVLVWCGTLAVKIAPRTPVSGVAILSVFAGLALVAGWYAAFAYTASINGEWLQTLPVVEALTMFATAATIAAVLSGIGAWFAWRRRARVTATLTAFE